MSRKAEWEKIRERREKVATLVERGFNARRISEVLNVSIDTVWTDLRALGIKLSERRAVTPTEKQEEAAALQHVGYSLREIGESMGCSAENARQHILAYEKKIKKRSQYFQSMNSRAREKKDN